MMTRLLAAGLTIAWAGVSPAAELPFFGDATFEITVGGQAVDVRRSGERHPYLFEEHSDEPEGFVLDRFHAESVDAGRGAFLRLLARDAGQRDQHIAASAGIFGSWRASAEFASVPTLYTTSTRSPFAYLGAGRLGVDDAIQRELANADDDELSAIAARVATNAPLLRVGFHRTQSAGEVRWTPSSWLMVRASMRDATRNGTRPLGIGRFDRVDGGFAVELFELAEPLEMRSDEFAVGSTLRGSGWHVDIDGSVMRFRNTITDIHYDSPFRLTEGIATAAPDTGARMIRASGSVELGPRALLGLSAAWTGMTQDQRFAPWTLNHAISGSGLPPGTGPVNVEALPRPTLEGNANAFSTDDSLAFRLTSATAIAFRYRAHDFANDTPVLAMPGYAGGGDTVWRTEFRGEPVVATPLSYRRQTGEAELLWTRRRSRARFSYERELVSREREETHRTHQDTVTAAVNWRRRETVASALLSHSVRSGHDAIRFDAANRTRNRYRGRVQLPAGDRLAIAASLHGVADDYGRDALGMRSFSSTSASVDVNVTMSEEATLTARVGRDATAYSYAQPEWTRDVDDVLTSAALGYDAAFGALSLHGWYELADARQTIRGRPEVKSVLQHARAEAEYELSARWVAGMRYRFEPYELADYATDDLSVYPLPVLSDADARRVLLLDARYAGHNAHVLGVYFRFRSDPPAAP